MSDTTSIDNGTAELRIVTDKTQVTSTVVLRPGVQPYRSIPLRAKYRA